MNKIYKLIFTIAMTLFLVSCTPENKSFVITFATNGGSLIESIVADKDQNIIMPNDPTKEGYTFGGWYLDSEFTQKLLSDYTLNDNITLYAKWLFTGIPISTVEDLLKINNDLTANYYLTNSIDLNGVQWVPIGTKEDPFTGNFDGNGFKLSNLVINNSSENIGLFGYTRLNEIKKLELENFQINVEKGSVLQNQTIGMLVSNAMLSDFHDIKISGEIEISNRISTEATVGGLVGVSNNSNLYNVTSNILINPVSSEGWLVLGGIIGNANGGKIVNGIFTGEIVFDTYLSRAGGLVGSSDGFKALAIQDSVNYGKVSGGVAGGIVGESNVNLNLDGVANLGEVYSANIGTAGGLVGSSDGVDIKISCSYNSGKITGGTAGGFIGESSGLQPSKSILIKESYNDGEIIAGTGYYQWGGGFIGSVSKGSTTIENSYNLGKISGKSGGFIGGTIYYEIYDSSIKISNSYSSNDFSDNTISVLVHTGSYFVIENTLVVDMNFLNIYIDYDLINSYYYMNGSMSDEITLSQLNSLSFYLITLGWDENIWIFDNLSFENGILPTLNNVPKYS